MQYELGIVDTRNIIQEINDKYNVNFKDYALTSFKRRVEKVIRNHSLKTAEGLLGRLETDPGFFETFLFEISVEATEMFRDPALWRVLKDEVLAKIANTNEKPKVWFPNVVAGDELYSLAVILHEMKIIDKFEIIASSICNKSIERIQSGVFSPKKMGLSEDNFKRIYSGCDFFKYYKNQNNLPYRDTDLIKNVKFIKHNILEDEVPDKVNLVIYRNQLIYTNQSLQDKILKRIYQSMVLNGLLVIGTKEMIQSYNKSFTLVNSTESIYKKRNT